MSATDNRVDLLRGVPLDRWIALSDDESSVIAVGSTYTEVVELSERAGVDDPVILKTPTEWATFNVSSR